MNFDFIQTLALLSITGVIVIAYFFRVWIKGPAKFSRVDQQGGSALLGKGLMEGAYWSLQPVARLLIFFRVSPNQISWTSFLLGFLAGAALVFGHFGTAAVLSTFSALLDSLDGMVARLTQKASDAGEVLDAAVDRYNEFFFLAGLTLYYREIPFLLTLSLIALMGSFMVSYTTAKSEALNIKIPKGNMRRPERALYLTLGAALSPLSIQLYELDRVYPMAMGYPMVLAVFIVAILSNISACDRLMALAKQIRVREREAMIAKNKSEIEVHEESENEPDSALSP